MSEYKCQHMGHPARRQQDSSAMDQEQDLLVAVRSQPPRTALCDRLLPEEGDDRLASRRESADFGRGDKEEKKRELDQDSY